MSERLLMWILNRSEPMWKIQLSSKISCNQCKFEVTEAVSGAFPVVGVYDKQDVFRADDLSEFHKQSQYVASFVELEIASCQTEWNVFSVPRNVRSG